MPLTAVAPAGAARRARSRSAPRSRPRSWCRASGSRSCSSAGSSCAPTARGRRCRTARAAPARLATGAVLIALAVAAGVLAGAAAARHERRRPARGGAHRARARRWTSRSSPARCPASGATPSRTPRPLYDEVVLKVAGLPAGALVRFATLDAYDGLVWGAADRSTDGVPFQQVGSRIAPRGDGTPVDVTVDVVDGGYSGYWLPTVGAPTRIEFDGPRSEELASELWLNPDTDTAVVPRRLLGGERYTMSALLPPAPASELPKDLDVASGGSSSQDLDLLDARLDSWTSRAEGAWGKLRAVAGQMRTEGTYTDGGTPNSFEKVYLPGHATARLSPVRQLHQAGRQRRAVRRHPGAGRAAARHPVAGRHGGRARAERGGPRSRRARLGRGAARRRVVVPAARQHLRAEPRQDAERAAAEVRGAEGRRPGAPAGRGQPALACCRGPTRRRTPPTSPSARSRRSTSAPGRGGSRCSCWASCCRCCCWPATCCSCAGSRRAAGCGTRAPAPYRPGRPWVWRDLVAEARSLGVRVPRRATRREQAAVVDAALGPSQPSGCRRPATGPRSVGCRPASAATVAAAVDAVVFGIGDGDPDAVLALHADAEAVLRRAARGHLPLDPLALRRRSPAAVRPRRASGGPALGRGGGAGAAPGIRRRSDADPTPA